jgi:hypothetical protein
MENTQGKTKKSLIKEYTLFSLIPHHKSDTKVSELKMENVKTVNYSEMEKLTLNLADKSYTPTAKDKLYFYAECTVPRFKVREMWKPKKVSITVKEEYGTHKFLSSKFNKYLDKAGNLYTIKASDLKKWLDSNNSIFANYAEHLQYDNLSEDVKEVLKTEGLDILIDYYLRNIINGYINTLRGKDSYNQLYDYPIAKDKTLSYEMFELCSFKEDKEANAWKDLYNDSTDFYLDDAVNRALQDESTVIDGEMYEQLKNLLESSDEANTTMAMEVIANSNIEKSAKFIYQLMREYSNRMVYNSAYNSVNFRSLRDSTGLDRYTRYDEDSYIKFIQKYDQADLDLVYTIREKCKEQALLSIKNLYQSAINSDILEIEIPYIKVILKGVNDGTQEVQVVDIEAEKAEEDIKANPEQYIKVVDEVEETPTPPCAAHDEAMQAEIEDKAGLDAEDREMFPGTMKQVDEALNFIADDDSEEDAEDVLTKALFDACDTVILFETAQEHDERTSIPIADPTGFDPFSNEGEISDEDPFA